MDGSATTEGARAELILRSPTRETHEWALRLRFRATNNEAEYEALLHGLRLALEMCVGDLEAFNDSQLVVGHVNGSFEAWDPTMALYLAEVRWLARCFDRLSITRIPHAHNAEADALARMASARNPGGAPATESLTAPIVPTRDIAGTEVSSNWMEEILRFKRDEA